MSKKEKTAWEKKITLLTADSRKLETKIDEIKNNKIYENAFEWRFEFPEVLDNKGDFIGFDVVIGNPPYGLKVNKENITILKLNFQKWKSDILFDSYFGFIIMGLSLCNYNGQLSYIVPNTWRLIFSAKNFRDELIDYWGLCKVDTFLSPVFSDAVVDCDLLFTHKNLKNDLITFHVSSGATLEKSNDIPKEIILSQNSINPHLGLKEYQLLDKIRFECNLLEQLVIIKNGVKPYEVGKGNPKQTEQITKEKPYTKIEKINSTFLPLIGGADFNKYCLLWNNNNYISYGPWLAAPRDINIFHEKEKIIVRQTSDKLIATIISDGFILRNNTHILLPYDKRINLKFILALMNSKLFDYIYWSINPERGEALAEVKAQHLYQLPVKVLDKFKQNEFVNIVDKILKSKKGNYDTDTSFLESKIDHLVYELYGLTEEEIGVVEGDI
jgi:hypothetical protein